MRTAVFIDGDSLHKLSKDQHIDVDFKQLRDMYRETGSVVTFDYFTVEAIRTVGDEQRSLLRKLLDWLVNNGFRVRNIEANLADEHSMRTMRSELVVWMGIEMVAAARRVDRIVLWSADRALWRAVEAAQDAGAAVDVVADRATAPGILARSADSFVDGRTLCPLIGQPKKATA